MRAVLIVAAVAGVSGCASAPTPVPPRAPAPAPAVAGLPGSPLSACRFPVDPSWYPADARKQGQSGTVTVALGVNSRGELDPADVLAAGSRSFEAAAVGMLKATHCRVPTEGPQSATASRYVVDIQFVLFPCVNLPRSEHAQDILTVCATRLK